MLSIEVQQNHGAMFNLELKGDDRQWLHTNYPTLKIEKNDERFPRITGVLRFDMVFYQEGKPYVIKPNLQSLAGGYRIQDEYLIEIVLTTSKHSYLPQVYEKGSRINQVIERKKLKPEDFHINPNGAACLCLNIQEKDFLPNGFNLEDFFQYLVIPFFYAQSYFEKNESWPWGQYGHGICGLLEWYLKQTNITKSEIEVFLKYVDAQSDGKLLKNLLPEKKEIKGHHDCVCGSTLRFRNCHKDALLGVWKLKQEIKKLDIQLI